MNSYQITNQRMWEYMSKCQNEQKYNIYRLIIFTAQMDIGAQKRVNKNWKYNNKEIFW